MTGMLSMVGTPIGNLQDASPRVISTLDAADVVLCEDTRVTGKLMAAFGLHTHLARCDENVIEQRVPTVLDRLRAGERVAFVSDAGMPGVSDPGQRLVDAALDEGLAVEVIPGPSAVTCALVASGLASEHFFFEGFLPRRAGEQCRRLRELALVPGALVAYESPYRVAATLANIAEVMPGRQVALVRELTKLHEEVVRGAAPELAGLVAERGAIKGRDGSRAWLGRRRAYLAGRRDPRRPCRWRAQVQAGKARGQGVRPGPSRRLRSRGRDFPRGRVAPGAPFAAATAIVGPSVPKP